MTETEQVKHDQQRRASDTWMQIKSAEIQHRNATLVSVATVIGLMFSGAWWLSTQAAREEVRPVRDAAKENAMAIKYMSKDLHKIIQSQESMTDGQDQMIQLLKGALENR